MSVYTGPANIGASVPRKEDHSLMQGLAKFVADIHQANTSDLAFLRSTMSCGVVRHIDVPAEIRHQVVLEADLGDPLPIAVECSIEGFNAAFSKVLSSSEVKYAGEPIAAAIAPTRAEAEDIVDRIAFKIDRLEPILDISAARRAKARHVHAGWSDNYHVQKTIGSELATPVDPSHIPVRRQLRTSRQCVAPLECRGILALWDTRFDQLIVYLSTQSPHVMRGALSKMLGLSERAIRVIAPAVGGGFGYKGVVLPEEILVCWLAYKRKGSYRWIQDRRENLITSASCREYSCDVTAHVDERGRIHAIEGATFADAGAYSAYPYTACLEGLQLGTLLSGPYDIKHYHVKAAALATNKPPAMPFRGTARPGGCYFTELLIDAIARKVGREPWEVRVDNLVQPYQMPYTNVVGKHFDSGDYIKCINRAISLIDPGSVRARQANLRDDVVRPGVGFAFYCEQAAYGAAAYSGLGLPVSPGNETCHVRLLADGQLEIRTGIQSHGQGLETTLAQVAHSILGIPFDQISVIHGDTGDSPYSPGTFGSRCMVIVGGAVKNACDELARRAVIIGAHMLQMKAQQATYADGHVLGGSASVSLQRIAKTWYSRPYELPHDVHPAGFDVIASYKPEPETGTFSYGCHASIVNVDIETGLIEIEKYVIVSDAGTLINPLIVDGQVYGGLAQGLGSALHEEAPIAEGSQPETFWEYNLPGALDMPDTHIEHMATPSPYTSFGEKGMGEGATIPASAAIANAVNDALAHLGVEICEVPITPARVRATIANRLS